MSNYGVLNLYADEEQTARHSMKEHCNLNRKTSVVVKQANNHVM